MIYRRPVVSRTRDITELRALVRHVIVEQVSTMMGRRPEEIDPDFF